jgi:hypothetical protein
MCRQIVKQVLFQPMAESKLYQHAAQVQERAKDLFKPKGKAEAATSNAKKTAKAKGKAAKGKAKAKAKGKMSQQDDVTIGTIGSRIGMESTNLFCDDVKLAVSFAVASVGDDDINSGAINEVVAVIIAFALTGSVELPSNDKLPSQHRADAADTDAADANTDAAAAGTDAAAADSDTDAAAADADADADVDAKVSKGWTIHKIWRTLRVNIIRILQKAHGVSAESAAQAMQAVMTPQAAAAAADTTTSTTAADYMDMSKYKALAGCEELGALFGLLSQPKLLPALQAFLKENRISDEINMHSALFKARKQLMRALTQSSAAEGPLDTVGHFIAAAASAIGVDLEWDFVRLVQLTLAVMAEPSLKAEVRVVSSLSPKLASLQLLWPDNQAVEHFARTRVLYMQSLIGELASGRFKGVISANLEACLKATSTFVSHAMDDVVALDVSSANCRMWTIKWTSIMKKAGELTILPSRYVFTPKSSDDWSKVEETLQRELQSLPKLKLQDYCVDLCGARKAKLDKLSLVAEAVRLKLDGLKKEDAAMALKRLA